jgi:hypothetical protein
VQGLFRQILDAEYRKTAREFLARHHPGLAIPMPIELIVEDSLGIRLLPVPDLFKRRKIWGYLNADLKGITHDALLIHGDRKILNSTLAHEVGHLLLHRDLYLTVRDDAEWMQFHRRLVACGVEIAEYQADILAGFILIPEGALGRETRNSFRLVRERCDRLVGPVDPCSDAFWYAVKHHLAGVFDVTAGAVERRLRSEGLYGTNLEA